jgi:hypothetical protein
MGARTTRWGGGSSGVELGCGRVGGDGPMGIFGPRQRRD